MLIHILKVHMEVLGTMLGYEDYSKIKSITVRFVFTFIESLVFVTKIKLLI